MMFICPKCESRVFTPTGWIAESVDCGNCGTTIDWAQGQEVTPAPPGQLAQGKTARVYIVLLVVAVLLYAGLVMTGYFG